MFSFRRKCCEVQTVPNPNPVHQERDPITLWKVLVPLMDRPLPEEIPYGRFVVP